MQTQARLEYSTTPNGPWSFLDSEIKVCVNEPQCTAIVEYIKPFGQCGYYYRTVGTHDWSEGGPTTTVSNAQYDFC